MQITDCHIHPNTKGDYHADLADLVSRMLRHKIARAIISDLGDWTAYPDEDTLMAANERLSREALKSDGRLEYLVYINPQLPGWKRIFDRFIDNSCGVKLWISLYSQEYGFERTKDVLRLAAQYDRAVLIHTFDRTVPLHRGEIGMAEVIELAGAVPDCRIVAAHSGGNWRKAVANASMIPDNVYFDISGGYPERTMVRRLVDTFGSKRILYGSDAYGRSFGSQLSKLHNCGLNAQELNDILSANSMRVFKLRPIGPAAAQSAPKWNIPDGKEDNFCFTGKSVFWDHEVTPEMLAAEAKLHGVDTLYAASLEALTCQDKARANIRHLESCAGYPQIKALAVADLRDMKGALEQLDDHKGFAGVLISPYLHCYRLDCAEYRVFFDTCRRKGIPVWINTALGDDRFRDIRLDTRPVTVDEMISFLADSPGCRYTFQGCPADVRLIRALPPGCRMECSRVSDGEYAPDDIFEAGVDDRLCFGSEYPFRDYAAVQGVLSGRF